MLECLVLGDSIATGVHKYRQECVMYADVGINSGDWYMKYSNKDFIAESVIISLGSNDYRSINTMGNLKRIREGVKAKKVYWILPAIKPDRQEMIKKIAEVYNDVVVTIPHLSKDGIHPTGKGYQALANLTK